MRRRRTFAHDDTMRISKRSSFFLTIALAVLTVWLPGLAETAAARKVALVIGNSNYEHATKLKNPVSDATALAKTLQAIGFDVIAAYDLNRRDLDNQLVTFAEKAADATVSLVYYAGHGLQVHGDTYLVPTDAKLKAERDVRRLIHADHVLKDAAQAAKLAVVIMDACRDNPFVKRLAEAMGPTRSMTVGRGLKQISNVPRNTLVAYATQAGNVALDGKSTNSPYATALIKHIHAPNKDIRMVFGSVRDTVLELTNQRQEPFIYGSLGGEPLYLHHGESSSSPATAAPRSEPEREEELAQALDPELVRDVKLVPQTVKRVQPIKDRFAAWQAAKVNNDWARIERLRIEFPDSLYGQLASLLLQLSDRAELTVKQAVTKLADYRADLSRLSPEFIKATQRKLSQASYYGGDHSGILNTQTREALYAFVRDVYGGGNVTYETFVVLAELSDTQSVSELLSGRWKGRYFYPREHRGRMDVPFEMDLVLSQGWIDGYVSEPNTFGDKTSKNLYATFSGAITGNKVIWTKKYDGTGGISHSVRYTGTLDRKKRRIEGRWIISSNWSGKFHIELE